MLPAAINLARFVLYYNIIEEKGEHPAMSKDLDRQNTAQRRGFQFLVAMVAVVVVGALAYLALTLVANRRKPAAPDTRYTGSNGITVYYESGRWPVCEMTEDDQLGTVLQLASGTDSDSSQYQVVLLQRGDRTTYEDFIESSESDLRAGYGVIKPRDVNISIEGATVTAVRCDIQVYYAVLATIEYDSGDVVYVSALTKLASINDIVNLVESVTLE